MRNLHLERRLDVGHPDELHHRQRRLGVDRLDADPGQVHPGADPDVPCPVKVRMGCYQDEKLGEECPFPERLQTGYYPDVGYPSRQELEALERHCRLLEPLRLRPQAQQGCLQAPLELPERLLQAPGPLAPLPLEQQGLLGQAPLELQERLPKVQERLDWLPPQAQAHWRSLPLQRLLGMRRGAS